MSTHKPDCEYSALSRGPWLVACGSCPVRACVALTIFIDAKDFVKRGSSSSVFKRNMKYAWESVCAREPSQSRSQSRTFRSNWIHHCSCPVRQSMQQCGKAKSRRTVKAAQRTFPTSFRICSVCPTAIRFRASSYYSNNNWTKPSWVEKNIPRLVTLLIVLSLAQPRPRHDATCTGIITAHPATCAIAAATASTTALTTAPAAVRKLPIAEIIKTHKCEPRAVCVRQQKYFN